MNLYIKNRVCHRCKLTVESKLKKPGLHLPNIELGEGVIKEDKLNKEQQKPSAFKQSGILHRRTLDFVKSKNPADNKF